MAPPRRSEDGFTLVELLVVMLIGSIVLATLFALIGLTARSSARTTDRVIANQRARPVMDRIIDELHSSCVRPDAPPIQAGSTGNSISFLHKTGTAVTPVPDKRVITLTGENISESLYVSNGGTAPAWTFSTTASSTQQLLTDVGPATIDSQAVPMFSYYSVENEVISTTPLPTPLSAANAAETVKVSVSFSASRNDANTTDPANALIITDSAVLSFTPTGGAATVGVPCV